MKTIDAQQQSRIFNITDHFDDFTFAGLTLTGGRTTGDNPLLSVLHSGGAVHSDSNGDLFIEKTG